MTAIAPRATSRSRAVRICPPRCGIHVAFGIGKLKMGRVFIVSSYPAFREPTTGITRFASFFPKSEEMFLTDVVLPCDLARE
jgi:hypothetical protein